MVSDFARGVVEKKDLLKAAYIGDLKVCQLCDLCEVLHLKVVIVDDP